MIKITKEDRERVVKKQWPGLVLEAGSELEQWVCTGRLFDIPSTVDLELQATIYAGLREIDERAAESVDRLKQFEDLLKILERAEKMYCIEGDYSGDAHPVVLALNRMAREVKRVVVQRNDARASAVALEKERDAAYARIQELESVLAELRKKTTPSRAVIDWANRYLASPPEAKAVRDFINGLGRTRLQRTMARLAQEVSLVHEPWVRRILELNDMPPDEVVND